MCFIIDRIMRGGDNERKERGGDRKGLGGDELRAGWEEGMK